MHILYIKSKLQGNFEGSLSHNVLSGQLFVFLIGPVHLYIMVSGFVCSVFLWNICVCIHTHILSIFVGSFLLFLSYSNLLGLSYLILSSSLSSYHHHQLLYACLCPNEKEKQVLIQVDCEVELKEGVL